jgi:hypothetical protein
MINWYPYSKSTNHARFARYYFRVAMNKVFLYLFLMST